MSSPEAEHPAGQFRFAAEDPVYEVFAVRYAATTRKRSETFVGGDPKEGIIETTYYVWVIRNASRTVVVDTGFDAKEAEARGRNLIVPVEEGLRRLGIDHEDVEDVVLTHLHFDHAGNQHLFPNARFHVPSAEMSYVTGPAMGIPFLRAGYGAGDITGMIERLFEDRLVFYEGRSELLPGIIAEPTPGHTKGLHALLVNTASGVLALASDSVALYELLDTGSAFAPAYSAGDEIINARKLLRLAGSKDRIVPGHDAAVMARYEAVVPEIAWRVDVNPR